uniref:ADP-ribosyl cyclase/cyclic ADP-ribose hydrolase n=1 Tax=Salix viminalis TaxID=40686 RepID=A0A6N2L7I2_SALVM
MASSSSSKWWKHDVFLNFRGPDTRNTFTSHLHKALCNKGVRVYIDDELERGKSIAPALLQSIEQSRISIAVFSETYASSSYCLDELVKMLECKESRGQVVLPVFYNVDPSDVEEQNDSFGEPVLRSASCAANMGKFLDWKEALTKAAGLSGWHLDNGNEANTIQSIVEKVMAVVHPTFLHVADYPVGLDSHIQYLNCQLRIASNDVFMVGIWGIGGIGKTTVAKAIYNEIADQFEGSSFLANVREMAKQNKVAELQQTLLSQILGDKNWSVGNIDFGISVIKDRLCSKKVLIVIDDVDNVDQLKRLAGEPDWFGAGSRIIITSRDEHVLVSHGVKIVHKVEELCEGDAFKLFSWHAFRKSQPKEELMKQYSCDAVTYANGLPLALVVLGSFLYGRSVHEWESQLDKLKQIPDKKVYEILKISYDGLEDGPQKAIFLDIACFFRGMDKDYVMKVLHACDFKPVIGVQVLIEKSLISIENNKLQMHDLLQAMGRQIVQQESPNIPGRRSRLWFHEDIVHVLTENTGTDEIEAIMLDFQEPEEIHLSAKAFKKMKRLRILIIHNALKLVVLNLQHSFIGHFEGFKNYSYLKFMNFSGCEFLRETPDFSTIRNLERLNLEGCANLVEVHQSVGYLDKLEFLNVEFCSNLRTLPRIIKLRSLNTLLLSGCQKLEAFPDVIEKMPCLEKLCLSGTAIKVLPSSIKNISGLKVLTLAFCRNLADLPNSIYKLTLLECLLLEGCSKLDKFPLNGDNEVPSNIPTSSNCYENSSGSDFLPAQANSLEGSSLLRFQLDLSGNIFAIIPETLSLFTHLKSLRLLMQKLQEIPALPRNIKRLEARDCELLERYSPLDKEGEWPAQLRVVDFSNCHKLAKNEGKNMEDAFFSKALHQKFQVEMFLPGSKIPEWFAFTSEQGSLTYLVPSSMFEKIQGLVICSILCLEDGMTTNISCEMFVDGKSMILCSRHFFPLETDHMWLYHQPYCYTRALGSARNDSVRFDISFEVLGAPRGSALKMCGIYFVYKQDKTMSDPSSTQSTSYHTDHSVSFDLMTNCYKVDPEFNTSPDMNRKRLATSDLTERFCNDELELSLNPRVSRRKTADDQCGEQFSFSLQPMDQKPGNPLIASKSGEHQLEHWLSLSLQPMDVSNWDPMCIKKLEEKVQLQPQREQKMNFFNELGRTPIGEHADIEYETKKDETDISDVESLA